MARESGQRHGCCQGLGALRVDENELPSLPEVWSPPLASRATRNVPMRSRVSSRGILVDVRRNRKLQFESAIERTVALSFVVDPEVVDIWDQPPAIEYKLHGDVYRHTFDFLIVRQNGERTAIAVKPEAKLRSFIRARKKNTTGRVDFLTSISEMAKQLPREFADGIDVFTENNFSHHHRIGFQKILSAAIDTPNQADAAVAEFARTMRDPIAVRDLIAVTGTSSLGFHAIARAIFIGTLEVPDNKAFHENCQVMKRVSS